MILSSRLLILLSALILTLATACGAHQEPVNGAQDASGPGFRIHRLSKRDLSSYPSNYTAPEWTRLVESGPLGDVILKDDDFAWYAWAEQRIALTPEASKRFSTLREKEDNAVEDRGFIASLHGKRQYAGLFCQPGSARPMDHPVIYVTFEEHHVLLDLRGTHILGGPYAIVPQVKRAITELDAVREHFLRTERLRP